VVISLPRVIRHGPTSWLRHRPLLPCGFARVLDPGFDVRSRPRGDGRKRETGTHREEPSVGAYHIMEAHIRTITPGDEAFLWTALYHALHVSPGADAFPPETVHEPDLARYVVGWMSRDGDLGVLAEVEGEPVGAAWPRRWSEAYPGFRFVDEATPELSMSVPDSESPRSWAVGCSSWGTPTGRYFSQLGSSDGWSPVRLPESRRFGRELPPRSGARLSYP